MHFDNNDWEPYQTDPTAVWDAGNSEWDYASGSAVLEIKIKGTWAASYRPTKIRLTVYSPSAQTVYGTIYSTAFGALASIPSQEISGEEILEYDLSWGSNDVYLIWFPEVYESFSIRNIEFYEV